MLVPHLDLSFWQANEMNITYQRNSEKSLEGLEHKPWRHTREFPKLIQCQNLASVNEDKGEGYSLL